MPETPVLRVISQSKARVAGFPATAEVVFIYPTPQGKRSQTWHVHYDQYVGRYVTRTAIQLPVALLKGLIL